MGLYELGNARTDVQLREMQDLAARGVCVFCPDQLHGEVVLHRTAFWQVTPNKFPYAETRLHLLLVPLQHVNDLLDLPPAGQADFFTALAWVRDRHALAFYSLTVRCGQCAATGASIEHLHAHVIVGDVHDPAHTGVRVMVSKPVSAGSRA